MNLVIVESPTKAKTISRFIGRDFLVKSSYGHVRDLPKAELGVDVEHDFQPKYIIPTRARKKVSELKKFAKKADKIILATDGDREGEAIAWHLAQALEVEKKTTTSKNQDSEKSVEVERIEFHEITESAIKKALENPRSINQNLVDAQQARRILDRLVGYKLSPFLWKKISRGLSAGRVQSVAVRLIVEREREIEAFKPQEYWTVAAKLKTKIAKDETDLSAQAGWFDSLLTKIGENALDKFDIKNQQEAKKIIDDLAGANYEISRIERKETIKNPFSPFTTSTLQQEGAKKLHFSAKQTMMLAQQLYEGIELGKGKPFGLITYMRTDSTNLSQESIFGVRDFIGKEFGKSYLSPSPRQFKTKSKLAQEAHEAIRPTDPSKTPDSIREYLEPNQYKLYNLIWRRFVATQMSSAIVDSVSVEIKANSKNKEFTFKTNGQTLKFDGFLKIYPVKFEEVNLPPIKEGEALDLINLNPEQHFTKPPARYNEASLVKTLELHDIGRPSTYAPTISTIQDRNYAIKDRNRYFHPTEIGIVVNDMLVKHFPKIVDIEFTSYMEKSLDEIAHGKVKWVPVIKDFYEPFALNLAKKYEEVSKEAMIEETDEVCEKCGKKMIIRMGRFGKFMACSGFPECKNAKSIVKKEVVPPPDIIPS